MTSEKGQSSGSIRQMCRLEQRWSWEFVRLSGKVFKYEVIERALGGMFPARLDLTGY